MPNKELEELKHRWTIILRHKAKYDHDARKAGLEPSRPDLDDLCNEMEVFFTALNYNHNDT
jgi:hypothetical protein